MVNLWPVNSNDMSGKTHNLIFEILGSHQAAPVTRCSTFLIKNLHDWKMEPSRFSFHFDCSCTANVIPAYWLFHMTGSSKCAISAYTWHDLNPSLSCRPVHNDCSLHLHGQVSCGRFRGRLRPFLRLGLDRLCFQPPLSHHLPCPAEEEWVSVWVREWKTTSTGKRSGGGVKPCIGFLVWFFGRRAGGEWGGGGKDRGSFTIWEE